MFSEPESYLDDQTTSCRVVATGPIQGIGTSTTSDEGHHVTLVHIVLPDGTVELRAKQVSGADQFKQAACVDTFTFIESIRVVGATGVRAVNVTGHVSLDGGSAAT